jgi:hypothetical protein
MSPVFSFVAIGALMISFGVSALAADEQSTPLLQPDEAWAD